MQRLEEEPQLGADPLRIISVLRQYLSRVGYRLNRVLPKDGSEPAAGPLPLATYTTGTLPDATESEAGIIYVSDGAVGAKFRGSDGSGWVNLG